MVESKSNSSAHSHDERPLFSAADYDILASLDNACHSVLEWHQLQLTAQMTSLRQTTVAAVAALLVLFVGGTAIVLMMCDVTIAEGLLFSVYTITSAGYGNVATPNSVGFLVFGIFYIYLGISALAINIAQVYQYLETMHKRQIYQQKKVALSQEGLQALACLGETAETADVAPGLNTDQRIRHGIAIALRKVNDRHDPVKSRLSFLRVLGRAPPAYSTALFLIGSLFIGTIAMILIEGWNFVEALYFATFSMTTVGYGDITPTSNSGTWFVVFWLTLNVPFLALYLGMVAHYFVRINQWKEQRIKHKMLVASTVTANVNVSPVPSSYIEPDNTLTMPQSSVPHLSVSFAENTINPANASQYSAPSVVATPSIARLDERMKLSLHLPGSSQGSYHQFEPKLQRSISKFDSVESLMERLNDNTRPWGGSEESRHSILSRFAAMERLAVIIVLMARLPSQMAIKSKEFWISIDSSKEIVVKWMIPYPARQAFRIAIFQTLLFVGERELVTHNMKIFQNMDPIHFNCLLGAVVLAMEGSVSEWMTATESLATENRDFSISTTVPLRVNQRRRVKNQIQEYFPVNQGNAVLLQL